VGSHEVEAKLLAEEKRIMLTNLSILDPANQALLEKANDHPRIFCVILSISFYVFRTELILHFASYIHNHIRKLFLQFFRSLTSLFHEVATLYTLFIKNYNITDIIFRYIREINRLTFITTTNKKKFLLFLRGKLKPLYQ
jgi:hypothetical protein